MTFLRAFFVLALVASGLLAPLLSAGAARAEPIVVTDMLDRRVTLPGPAQRVVLAEGRHVLTLALLDDDPVSLLAGWGNDLKRYSPETYEALRAAFPAVDAVPDVGGLGEGAFSMEAVIATRPDLVIFTLYGPPPDGIDKLDAAGIPYIFVDFFQEPLTKTVPSMRLLGTVLDRDQAAEDFIAVYEEHMDRLAARLETTEARPDVLFHLNPNGKDCCFSSGPGNMSDFIAAAGGHNIGQDKIPGAIGRLNLEYILARQPAFYLAGGGSTVSLNGLRIGPGVSRQEARDTFRRVTQAPGLADMAAVQDGKAAGIWLFFFDNPLFFVGVEAIATMLHPELFADVDPARTMETLNERFLPFDLSGTFWITATDTAE